MVSARKDVQSGGSAKSTSVEIVGHVDMLCRWEGCEERCGRDGRMDKKAWADKL
jgi:hypothetical protein